MEEPENRGIEMEFLEESKNDNLEEEEKRHCLGAKITAGNQIYQNSVIDRALKRAGKCKNLKGHINEIRTCDRFNLNPKNIIERKIAVLTKSPIAVRDDIVIKQGGKVIGRKQLKDTISKSGIQKTAKQVADHKYKGTTLVGTKETVQEYTKIKATNPNISQTMTSNGISSTETELLAKKALGGNILENSDKILNQAGKTAKTGAVISGGLELGISTYKVATGQESVEQAAKSVVNETVIGGTSAAIGDATATGVTMLVAATPAAPIAPIVGIGTGMGISIATDKSIRKLENSINKSLKKHEENKKMESVKRNQENGGVEMGFLKKSKDDNLDLGTKIIARKTTKIGAVDLESIKRKIVPAKDPHIIDKKRQKEMEKNTYIINENIPFPKIGVFPNFWKRK